MNKLFHVLAMSIVCAACLTSVWVLLAVSTIAIGVFAGIPKGRVIVVLEYESTAMIFVWLATVIYKLTGWDG